MQQNNQWMMFPAHLEQKINSLLYEAEPKNSKAFQLYKVCKNEDLWRNSFELFCVHLSDFFSLPHSARSKSYFDNFLDRPMNRNIYDLFDLNFRTAKIDFEKIQAIADWANNCISVNCKIESVVASKDVISKTIGYLTDPPEFEKDKDIEFDDFCRAWKLTVFKLFGRKYDSEFEIILNEIRWLRAKTDKLASSRTEQTEQVTPVKKSIYLTQTEIDWTTDVMKAVKQNKEAPEFPLSRGPQKQLLIDLQKSCILYDMVLKTNRPEILKYRQEVCRRILLLSEKLLNESFR